MRHNHNGGNSLNPQMSIQPNIGLDGDARRSVVEILNTTLADEAVLTMKTCSAHWHVHGPGFLDFQTLFDQQFHQLIEITDGIAERVCVLGGVAISSFEEFLKYTRLEEHPGGVPGVMNLLADHEAVIRTLREDARRCFEEFEDHGSFTLLVGFIQLHERMAWILRSYVEPNMTVAENLGNKAQPKLS